MLGGGYANGGLAQDDHIYMALNMHWKRHRFKLPILPQGTAWRVFAHTGNSKAEVYQPDTKPRLDNQQLVIVRLCSIVILVGK